MCRVVSTHRFGVAVCTGGLSGYGNPYAQPLTLLVYQSPCEQANQRVLALALQEQESQVALLAPQSRITYVARQWLVSGLSWVVHAHRHQQPPHWSCAAGHRRCWETRVSHLSHGCHAGSSAVRFRWPILPGRSVVVGTAQQYDQVPICGWPGGVFGRVRHVKVQIGLWHHERHAVLWKWPVAGRGEREFRISSHWHSVWR